MIRRLITALGLLPERFITRAGAVTSGFRPSLNFLMELVGFVLLAVGVGAAWGLEAGLITGGIGLIAAGNIGGDSANH